jgi:hypothetical protein
MASASPLRRCLWLLLLVAALSVRGLTPDGWMTMRTADGGIALMPCDGMAPASSSSPAMSGHHMMGHTMAAHHGDDHHKQDHSNRADHPCAFAGIAALDGAPPPLALAAPIAPDSTPPALARFDILPGRGLAAPPPPATGPPALA